MNTPATVIAEIAARFNQAVETERGCADGYHAADEARRLASDAWEQSRAALGAARFESQMLARAFATLGNGIVWAPFNRTDGRPEYGGEMRASFALVRITAWGTSGEALTLEANVSLWRTSGTMPQIADWPTWPTGTSNPDKLKERQAACLVAARRFLEAYTAERWLEDRGVDPATAPALADVVTWKTDAPPDPTATRRGYVWHEPVWEMLLGGVTVAKLERDTYRIADARAEAKGSDHRIERNDLTDVLYQTNGDREATVVAAEALWPEVKPLLLAAYDFDHTY